MQTLEIYWWHKKYVQYRIAFSTGFHCDMRVPVLWHRYHQGAIDRRLWLQAATRALESLPEAVEPLQATLDASLPEWQYSVGFEAVRCMHAEVCRLLIRRRLSSLSGPQWVALVDECMQWERMV